MAPTTTAAAAASSSKGRDTGTSASPLPRSSHSPAFTAIQENERESDEEEIAENAEPIASSRLSTSDSSAPSKHQPTPLRPSVQKPRGSDGGGGDGSVSWNKCRPTAREKISIVPLDSNGVKRPYSNQSPSSHGNGIFKSLFSSLTRKSPRSPDSSKEEQWKLAVAELSHKLQQASRKRDEALLEASRLKHSMSELEKKLNKLEIYCHELKSGLEVCSTSPFPTDRKDLFNPTNQTVESFLHAVSDARSSVRHLSRSLTAQIRQAGGKIHERVSALLQPYDVKISTAKSPKSLLFYLEAVLNRAFYDDFESSGFQKNGSDQILNPVERCDANFASYVVLRGLSWDEVLTKGTRHFSESFSGFCDRKMSEIVGMMGWNRAWPESLLQAFFCAAKGVWLVHLLARAVHPSLPIFRVETGARFEGAYMEDMVGDRVRRLVPDSVRVMVAPGFYVFTNVIKCKVLCRYNQQVDT